MEIEKHIVPSKGLNRGLTAALKKMEIGDSVLVFGHSPAHVAAGKIGIKVRTQRTDVPFQVRAWRVA